MANLHVNLAFSADTGKAKAQIQELQTLLSKIAYTGSTSNNITGTMQKDLQQASTAAKELQFHLNNAFNTTTGKFDLSLLDKSLKTSGTNISNLSTQLLGAGTTGQQAFMKLAQSISLADQPMLRISKRMQEFAVTMKNTVKWQLSSSMLHGFMGAIQSAYGYAQDLNKSLTDIRIVTGYSADQMAVFAEQANKAAKSLSTTTNDYTNASLIYFQQGLTDAEVAERTAVTVKMANAAGESAQIVSDQLTAVWNNFYDGSKSLEYYADVMTALGAATASSTDEISEGLSKFAAVAETVGLSYEYATAALTTITSNTRESADVVGNALKTLFARIQGLKLGETLEDGVGLNKYSEALDKVGISIFESNGELKAMDNILIELAGRWDTMSNAQQVALAQTMAGVRQYTQLIALMENWDNGDTDSMMANLRTIEGAEGALDEQAEIYAQSWEAAQKRVQAAAEGIYQSLLDDDFFISIANGFANLLGGLDAFIDSAGGVKTILTGIAGVVLSTFAHQIPQALDTLKYNISVVTKGSQKAYADMQEDINKATKDAFNAFQQNTTTSQFGIKEDSATGYAIKQANELTAARSKLAIVSDKMSAAERQAAEVQLGLIQAQQNEVIALKEKNEQMQEAIRLNLESIKSGIIDSDFNIERGQSVAGKLEKHYGNDYAIGLGPEDFAEMQASAMELGSIISTQITSQLETAGVATEGLKNDFNGTVNVIEDASGAMTLFGQQFDKVKTGLQTLQGMDISDSQFSQIRKQAQEFIDILPSGVANIDAVKKAINNLGSAKNVTELTSRWEALEQVLKGIPLTAKNVGKALEGSANADSVKILSSNMGLLGQNTEKAAQEVSILENLYKEFQPTHVIRMSEAFGALGGLIGNVSTSFMSLKSAIQAIINPDLSGWEKFSAVLSSAGMLIPNILSGMSSWATLNAYNAQLLEKENLALTKQAMLNALNANSFNYKKGYITISQKIVSSLSNETKETLALTLAEAALKNSKQALTAEEKQQVISKIALILADGKQVTATHATVAANLVEDASTKVLTTSIWGLVKAKMALHPVATGIVIAIAAIAAVVAAAVAAYNYFTVSQEEANEAIAEANNAYDEEKQKLDELNNSLKSVRQSIEELLAKDTLTITEEQELARLREQEASLERQVVLQERLAELKQAEAARVFEENADKASEWVNDIPTDSKREFIAGGYEYTNASDAMYGTYSQTTFLTAEEYKAQYIDPIEAAMEMATGNELIRLQNLYNERTNLYNDWVADDKAALGEWTQAHLDSYNELIEGYKNWLSQNPNASDEQKTEYANTIAAANKAFYGDEYEDVVYGSMKGSQADEERLHNKDFGQMITESYTNGDVAMTAAELADTFSETFKNSLYANGILPKDYAQWLIDDYDNQMDLVKDKLVNEGSSLTMDQITGDSRWNDDYLPILANIEITGEEDLDAIFAKIDEYKNNKVEVGFNLDSFKSNYSFAQGIEEGDTFSADDIAALDVAYQQYFQEQLDGSYQLKISAQEFKSIVESIELEKLQNQIKTDQSTLAGVGYVSADDLTAYSTGEKTDKAFVEAMGGTWNENDAQAQIDATQQAAAAYQELTTNLIANSEALSLTVENEKELREMYEAGLISMEHYNERLEEMRNKLDEDVDAEQYENLTEIIQSMAEASDDNNEGAMEFSENLKDNQKAAENVAEAILRYDSAVEDVKKNSKDWMKILKSGNLQDMASIMDDLSNSYEDLLDLDGDVLSDDFVTNAENLELMTKAANGSVEAYNELARRAAEDIIAQCKLEVDFDQAKFDAALAEFQSIVAGIDLPNLEVGADLTGVPGFIEACNQIINAAGMTADQATSYLASMGVDAEVKEQKTTTTDTVATNLVAHPDVMEVPYYVPSAWGTPMQATATFPYVSYTTEAVPGTKEQTAVALEVTSATKSSGGAIKHANSSSGSGSNSKPSGGGGGGSKQAPKYAEKKNDSDKERYHTVLNQLEDLSDHYDDISEAADRAFGREKVDAINKEIGALDNLIAKQEEYIREIQTDLPVDKAVMSAYYSNLIGGTIKFDAEGNISNFDQIQDAMYNKYNQMASTYTEDSTEWQAFEKQFEQLEKYIEQYEETYDLLRDAENELQDYLYEKIDLQLEAITYAIDLELDVSDDSLALVEYQLDKIDNDGFKAAESIALMTEQAELFYDKIVTSRKGLEDILGLSLLTAEISELMNGNMDVLNGKTFTEDQIDAIKDYRDELLSLNEEFDEIRESIEEQVMEAFDAWHEKLEDGIDKFDHYGSVLESYQNIIDIVGKDVLGVSDAIIGDLAQANVENAINQVEATKDAYEALQQAQLDAEEELEKAKARGDEQSIQFWTDTLNEIQTQAEDAQEEMMSAWEEALDRIAEQFEAAVQTAVDAFNEAVYQLGGIEALSNEFDRQQEMADMYLDDYQKIYELSKLNRDINNSIDDTDSLAGKQKLKKLLGEINELQADGVEMSQYDLEYLQAEYDLRLAEIALEEAQRAKDVVRLQKDNEGNWSYVYTQNTDAVDEAQQKYEDALYAMQDLSSNYIDEMSQQLIETSQEMQEALAAIRVEDYASIEEYYEEVERIQEQYQEEIAMQEAELQKAVDNNKELYDTDWTNYHNATGYKISDTEEFVTKFSDSLLGTLMNSESATVDFGTILGEATDNLVNELYLAAENYYTNLANIMAAAGTSTDGFAADLAENVDQIKADSEEAAIAVEDMATRMQEQMDNVINKVAEWQQTYGEAMQEIINANLAVIESFNEMIATLSMDDSTVTVTYDIQNANQDVQDASQFDTGGYTGTWGNTGKLAVLHEKELILNSGDTSNMLKAMQISKLILDTIELNAQQASYGMGALTATTVKDEAKQILEQTVQITAEFPDATDHNEIKEAFNNLINYSSQYANRK